MRTILSHFDLDIDFWPHFSVYRVWSISPRLQLTFLKSVLCLTNSFGGIRHVTVTFLVSKDIIHKLNSNSQHLEVVSHNIFKESTNLQIIVFMCISLT